MRHYGSPSEKACYERIQVAREICLDGSWVYGDGNNAFAAALSSELVPEEGISL
jgi:hypothetical protein